jgi:tRNA threonylcarbamoyladenosine biosynthesis protein TsaB
MRGEQDKRWLLLNGCGANAVLALSVGARIVRERTLAGREFSRGWSVALRNELAAAEWTMAEFAFVGVVSGPGSFTGVRVALAAAKGLCEVLGVPLVTLSRLRVLAGEGGAAALDAGRGELYVRDGEQEVLLTAEAAQMRLRKRDVVTLDASVAASLPEAQLRFAEDESGLAAAALWERWSAQQFTEAAAADANYVRGEDRLYAARVA